MRIQHNITAMNSYRNFNANSSKLGKNLEKLSSGYKINRAGDDAAGLAISEKMRAQITGIEGATKNSKDGISLIQTAEGALTEVHDMLNRMTTLAEQSANGTYQNELDREQLQKEVGQLKEEIDRIADSTNFNGLKLLDGSLGGEGGLKGNVNLNDTKAIARVTTTADFGLSDIATSKPQAAGDKISYTMSWMADGKANEKTIEFTVSEDKKALIASDGTEYAATYTPGDTASDPPSAVLAAADIGKAVLGELQKDSSLTSAFDIELANSDQQIKFTSKVKGTGGAEVTSSEARLKRDADGTVSAMGANTLTYDTKAEDAMQKVQLNNLTVLTKAGVDASGDVEKTVSDNTFEIDGKKFVMIAQGQNYDDFKKIVDSDTTIIQMEGANNAHAKFVGNATDSKIVAAELSRVTGRNFTVGVANANAGIADYDILLSNSRLSKSGKGLDLQIGDTADSFNKLSVTVGDMHAKAIGIGDVDISTQEGASVALDKIKNAINTVSDTRGTLGSLQNRLEHTINNLGVQRENIQNAESLIRDTDVAEEMMTYTKNNILNQSAQAMLAQANQLPQGVLQLLQ